jgi:HEAT repeat protein
VGDGELEELVLTLASGGDDSREAAAMALGRFGTAALDPVAVLLTSDDAGARWWAARALAEVGGEGAVGPLTRVLEDENADVRACASLALGQSRAASAAPALAARLADESAFVAGIAADALSMLGEGAIPALAQMLRHERPGVRFLAVRALERIGSEQAIEPLCSLLQDPSYLVSQSALDALEKLGVGMVYFNP